MNTEPTTPNPSGVAMWERPAAHSLEYCGLQAHRDGYTLSGTVILLLDDQPAQITYAVDCDLSWRTRTVTLSQLHAATLKKLHIKVDGDGQWWTNDTEMVSARGLLDIDLSITPATNTLPIRRFGLDVGQSREVSAVWVLFPSLELKLLEQRYTRTHADQYLYQSLASGFQATLTVDALGLVNDYEGIWHRLGAES